MPWPEITARPTDRQLREFAAAGAALCCAMAVWQVVGGNWWPAGAWLLSAVVVGGSGFWRPRWLAAPFKIAMIVTYPLAWAMSLLVLVLIFYGLITPLGLLLRLLGRDVLNRRNRSRPESYWKPRPRAADAVRYLRQY